MGLKFLGDDNAKKKRINREGLTEALEAAAASGDVSALDKFLKESGREDVTEQAKRAMEFFAALTEDMKVITKKRMSREPIMEDMSLFTAKLKYLVQNLPQEELGALIASGISAAATLEIMIEEMGGKNGE